MDLGLEQPRRATINDDYLPKDIAPPGEYSNLEKTRREILNENEDVFGGGGGGFEEINEVIENRKFIERADLNVNANSSNPFASPSILKRTPKVAIPEKIKRGQFNQVIDLEDALENSLEEVILRPVCAFYFDACL